MSSSLSQKFQRAALPCGRCSTAAVNTHTHTYSQQHKAFVEQFKKHTFQHQTHQSGPFCPHHLSHTAITVQWSPLPSSLSSPHPPPVPLISFSLRVSGCKQISVLFGRRCDDFLSVSPRHGGPLFLCHPFLCGSAERCKVVKVRPPLHMKVRKQKVAAAAAGGCLCLFASFQSQICSQVNMLIVISYFCC